MTNGKIFCPGHPEVAKDLREMKQIQRDRPCGENKAHIEALKKETARQEKDNSEQWTAINQLRKTVWGWAPLMSFLGSAIGAIVVSYLMKSK
jgi:hypothetical protein